MDIAERRAAIMAGLPGEIARLRVEMVGALAAHREFRRMRDYPAARNFLAEAGRCAAIATELRAIVAEGAEQ